jgi:hypothetical protein
MHESERKEPERYYLAYQRLALVGLLSTAAVGVYFLAVVFGGVGGALARSDVLILIGLFAISVVTVPFITLRGRLWRRSDAEARLVLRDEWTHRNRNRAYRTAFAVVMWAQLPLAFLMNRLALEPSFSGMAGLSMALGAAAFFAAYLFAGRQQGDG